MRIPVLGLVALGLIAGCRDLVQPELAAVDPADSFIEIFVFGLSSPLHEAEVTIDNSEYAGDGNAGQWSATSILGEVRFIGAGPGDYDVHVVPDHRSDTPEWEASRVALEARAVSVSYAGTPVEVRLDWPELAVLGADESDTRVNFLYLLPDPRPERDTYKAHVGISIDEDGRYMGALPRDGTYAVVVTAGGEGFSLNYGLPDSVVVIADSVLALASPFRREPVTLLAGGEPLVANRVQIDLARIGFTYGLTIYRLSYSLDRSARPDSVYLLHPQMSQLTIRRLDGPAFLPQVAYLSPQDMSPGSVDVGGLELSLQVTDLAGAPVPGADVTVDHYRPAAQWLTDAGGKFELLLKPGAHQLRIDHPGYRSSVRVVELDADLAVTVALDAEGADR